MFMRLCQRRGPSLQPSDGAEVSKAMSSKMMDGWGILPGSIALTWMFIPILGTVGQPSVLTRMYALKKPGDMPKLALYSALGHMVVGFFALCMAYAALYLVGTGQIAPLAKGDNAIICGCGPLRTDCPAPCLFGYSSGLAVDSEHVPDTFCKYHFKGFTECPGPSS